jgi:hypothetical protein
LTSSQSLPACWAGNCTTCPGPARNIHHQPEPKSQRQT